MGNLVKLPKNGKALIITDIHGNLNDYNKYMHIWDKFENSDNHLILTGDFIHAMGRENDGSIEIMESVQNRCETSKNFHVLLGNHEWSTITKKAVYKAGINQTLNFDELLRENFGQSYNKELEKYVEFLRKLPIAVRTANKVFISHAGPPRNIKSLDDINHITDEGYNENLPLFEILWNRFEDYTENDLKSFLKTVNCEMMIVGHSPVDGIKLIYKNLLIVSSSYSEGKKAYVELDLKYNIKNSQDIINMVKYL
jgi:serine/threonine-protein phosphatase PP1 catalytic subunit